MRLIICPGVHHPILTAGFLAGLGNSVQAWSPVIIPSDRPPYCGWQIMEFLHSHLALSDPDGVLSDPDGKLDPQLLPHLLFIGFSAGVVGAMTAAHLWQNQGGRVAALIAIDGWGVPLVGSFPIHRVSHDALTHWSTFKLAPGGTVSTLPLMCRIWNCGDRPTPPMGGTFLGTVPVFLAAPPQPLS